MEVVVERPVTGLDVDAVRELTRFVLAQEGAAGSWTVSVVVTDDDRLRALHRDFMGIDTTTDVMTFPLGAEQPGDDSRCGGDIVISGERAAEQAAEFGHSAVKEVDFLIVHGLLHLRGWRDDDDADRRRMLARQSDLLALFTETRRDRGDNGTADAASTGAPLDC